MSLRRTSTSVRRLASAPAYLLLGCLLLAACSGESKDDQADGPTLPGIAVAPQEQLASFYSQKVTWAPCDPGFECTTVKVPLDYAKPQGRSIDIAVNRARATGDRLGSLLLNPGGPGASGLSYAIAAKAGLVKTDVRERFDLVGFDPRGVGKSSPINCVSDAQLDAINAVDATPDSAAEEKALVASADELAAGCAKSKDLVAHVGTRESARDMDVIRAVLGDEKLNFLGSSYGTFLGALYADAFPDRTGRMVLDGALDPRVSDEDLAKAQAVGFDRALGAFVDDCLTRSDCPLAGPRDTALKQVRGVLDRADAEPYPTQSGRDVTQSLAFLGVATPLYDSANGWPLLRSALSDAIKSGTGDRLLALADLYTERGPKGYRSNAVEALAAISCLDRGGSDDLAKIRADQDSFAKAAPTFGPFLAWSGLGCGRWKVPAQGGAGAIRAKGAPPILVIGTTRDPATPVEWARGLASELDSGVLLIRDGDGHLAYNKDSACIDDAVSAYLIRGETPKDGTTCS